jgi:hypothetical protein
MPTRHPPITLNPSGNLAGRCSLIKIRRMPRVLIPAHLVRRGDILYLEERLVIATNPARLDGEGHRLLAFRSADGQAFERKWPEDSAEPWFDRLGQDCSPADPDGLRDFIHQYLEEHGPA